MKITKEIGDGELGIYKPDYKEQEKIAEVSDKVIDLITEESLEKTKVLENVDKFHNIIKLLFEKSIKDELRKEMGGT